MSDYLTNLVARSLNRAEVVQPRLARLFESPQTDASEPSSQESTPVESPLAATPSTQASNAVEAHGIDRAATPPRASDATPSADALRASRAIRTSEEGRFEPSVSQGDDDGAQEDHLPAQATSRNAGRSSESSLLIPLPTTRSVSPASLETGATQFSKSSIGEESNPGASPAHDAATFTPSEETRPPFPTLPASQLSPATPSPSSIRLMGKTAPAMTEAMRSGMHPATDHPSGALESDGSHPQSLLLPVGAENTTARTAVSPSNVWGGSEPAATADARRVRPHVQTATPAARADTEAKPDAPPTIHVSIGRIEVRAVTPPAPAPPRPSPARPAPEMSLDDYLRRSHNGGRK